MVERWHQLPLGHASAVCARALALVQELADEAADLEGRPRLAVRDLGPAVVMDQLTVMVHDLAQLSSAYGSVGPSVADRLADLRRAL